MRPVITVYTPFKPGEKKSGETMSFGRDEGERLSDVLMDISKDRWGGQHVELFRENYTEDKKIPIEDAVDILLQEDDRFILVVLPAGFAAFAPILGGSLFSSFAVSAAVGFGLSFLSNALKPSVWVGAGAAARTKPSPLNQLEPPRNQPRLGSRIPSIYGKMRTWPDLIFPPYEVWGGESGTDGRIQTLYSAYGVTEGLANLEELYVGESPVEAVTGAEVTFHYPGEPLPSEFHLVRNNATFLNVPLVMAQDWPDPAVGNDDGWNPNDPNAGFTDWIRLPDLRTNRIVFQFLLPNGALQAEYKYGSSGPYTHKVTYQYRRLDPVTGAPQGSTSERSWSVSLKSTSPHRYTFEREVSEEGLYEVRVRREDNSLGRDKPNGSDIDQYNRGVTVVSIGSLHVMNAEERTNDTTRVLIKFTNFSASSQVSVNAQSRFSCVATRNLAEVKLDGTGIGPVAATSRWIDAMYHMLTDPFLGGYPEAEIDVDSLIKVQKTMLSRAPVDEQPESGEFCAIYDSLLPVDEQVQSCAVMARASLFSDGARVIAAVDADNRFDEDGNTLEPYQRVAALFNRRNRAEQDADAGIAMRAALPTEADGVEIRWIDRDSNWTPRTFTYTPSGSSTALRPIRVEAKGITSWPQAYRHAVYLFRRNLYRRKTTTVRAFEEARLLTIYDTVAVVQPWREITIDGQLIEYDDSAAPVLWATLDKDVSGITAGVDTIRIRGTDGTETEIFDILTVDPAGNRVRIVPRSGPSPVISIMAGIPQTQIGNLYTIATDADHEQDQWIVLGSNAQTYEGTLTLANADNRVFDGDKTTELLPEYPELPFTAPRTPICTQHPCLALWYWPEQDQNFTTRATLAQEPFEFQWDTNYIGDPFGSGLGLRMAPQISQDRLQINSLEDDDKFEWWAPGSPGTWDNYLRTGIWYFDIEVNVDMINQTGVSNFIWYFRRSSTNYYGISLAPATQPDTSEIVWVHRINNSDRDIFTGVTLDNGGRFRIAVAFDDPAPVQGAYVYVGVAGQQSVKSPERTFDAVVMTPPLNFYLGSGSGANDFDGTMIIREFRVYNCIPSEQFVQDLASGLITECAL